MQLGTDGVPATFYAEAGDRYGDSKTFVNVDTGESGSTGYGAEQTANELLVVRNYSALAPHYGIPDIVPALQTLQTDVAAREYQGKFFDNDAVPRFAVLVEGGELTDKAWKDLENKFKDLKLSENSHRGIIIEAVNAAAQDFGESHDVSIEIQPLTVGVNEDGSFLDLRKENEHDILKAHSVPPVVANRTENVNYSNAKEQRQEFAQTVIRPKQTMLAARIYNLIHKTMLGVDGWTIEFELHGAENRTQEAEIAKTRIQASQGVMTVNEARAELGLDPLADSNGKELPEGAMLLAELGSNASQSPAAAQVDQAVQNARDEGKQEQRAESLGYDINSRLAESDD